MRFRIRYSDFGLTKTLDANNADEAVAAFLKKNPLARIEDVEVRLTTGQWSSRAYCLPTPAERQEP